MASLAPLVDGYVMKSLVALRELMKPIPYDTVLDKQAGVLTSTSSCIFEYLSIGMM